MKRGSSFFSFTNDAVIRAAMKARLHAELEEDLKTCPHAKIIEELGVSHGEVRIDIAVVNGIMHGYELKSDLDNLDRLPTQMRIYNAVFDRVTLVVGKAHLHEAIRTVPEWWGITVAKAGATVCEISLYTIREPQPNTDQDTVSIASLLWRDEALQLLESIGCASGVRSKPRQAVYERLATNLDGDDLRQKVRETLCSRVGWRSDLQYTLSGG